MDARNTLILGIGNTLMTDDGVGVHAVRALADDPQRPPHVRCLDGGTLGYLLAGQIGRTTDLIVIDAAQLHAPPGTVSVLENEAMDQYLNSDVNRSVHEAGLADLMLMALLSDGLPPRRALIAVQPSTTAWGSELSPAVADAMPVVSEKTWDLVRSWRP